MADCLQSKEPTSVLVESAEGEFLLLKRAPHKKHAGKWDLAGGGVEAGETPEQAAIKELAAKVTPPASWLRGKTTS